VELHQHLTPSTIVAEVRMTRSLRKNCSIFMVEGPSDSRFWKPLLSQRCEIIIAGGKGNLTNAVRMLSQDAWAGILGVADADLDRIRGVSKESDNLIYTDCHDLETTLIGRTSVLDEIIEQYGSSPQIQALEENEDSSLLQALLERTMVFGRLRWYALEQNPPLDMHWLKPSRYLGKRWNIDFHQLLKDAVEVGLARNPRQLEADLDRLPRVDPWDVVQGHDMLKLLYEGLRHRLGRGHTRPLGLSDLDRALRSWVEQRDVERLDMTRHIRIWQGRNPKYRVLD
jgi:hypothetical protein